MRTEYDLRRVGADPAELVAIGDLLRAVFPKARHFTDQVLHWQYMQNPAGHAVGFNAWSGVDLAAHYVTIPMLARVQGQVEKGLLSLNTTTHPSHQGKGLFTTLANATYTAAAAEGHRFVVGVANTNSVHGFTRKLGFQLVTPLRAMVGKGPLPRVHAPGDAFDPVRGPEWLAWRARHPLFRYGRTASGLVLAHRRLGPFRYVLASLSNSSAEHLRLPLGQAPFFKAWLGWDGGHSWFPRPYLNVPMRFRPSPLHLIFKDLSGAGRHLDPRGTRFQAIDFDVL
ncbi:MAG: GNAT family N-acetyltransferase [Flavobacteriales bacterium]|nr:GNAT family N-acetyltransferase [Flavobacteriales bacterium]